MANSIAYTKNYTTILDEVYQRESVSGVLNSGRRIVRAGRNAKEIMIPKIQVTGLGDYTRNVGYKTGSITYEFETKTFNYDRGIRLMADVMDIEEAGVLDCFVEAGAELQRTQVAPEADAFSSCAMTTLDFRGFYPSTLTVLFYCFSGCSSLTTISAVSTWVLPSNGISGSQSFYSCSSLAGGNDTKWSSSNTYMGIDRAGQAGYLTAA